jgi:PAS domain S-box-containing protein
VTALQRDGKVLGEYSFVRPGGEEWTAVVSAQLLQLAGRPTGISSIIDITSRKQFEEALRTSEAIARQHLVELEAIYETAPIGLCVFDENLRWIRLNRIIAEINGRAIEDHIGRTPSEIVPDVGAQAEEALRTILRTGGRLDFEMSGTTAAQPGVERFWSEHWVPMKDADGRIVGISVAAEEITDRKRAAEALRKSEAALREADRRKDEFLAWLSHELRNPLNVIRGNLSLIDRMGLDNEGMKRLLPALNRQTALMSHLLDDLLDVTRISKGKIHLQPKRVALSELVRTIGEDHREAFDHREIHFEVRVPDEPLPAVVDQARISQVVGNLLQNAAKFTPSAGHVFLSLTRAADAHAIIQVGDDGAGIRQELLASVFEPLVQDERMISKTQRGLGLGLALVKGLVELHGGTVSAASAGPGRGSVFTARLPLLPGSDS